MCDVVACIDQEEWPPMTLSEAILQIGPGLPAKLRATHDAPPQAQASS